jgi:hypothetical protein
MLNLREKQFERSSYLKKILNAKVAYKNELHQKYLTSICIPLATKRNNGNCPIAIGQQKTVSLDNNFTVYNIQR